MNFNYASTLCDYVTFLYYFQIFIEQLESVSQGSEASIRYLVFADFTFHDYSCFFFPFMINVYF